MTLLALYLIGLLQNVIISLTCRGYKVRKALIVGECCTLIDFNQFVFYW
uniref:Uncharacterized protein n=1 Tax=Arundo donax TaxID=35708 RepID=A0A0A9CB79_ARUDO